MKVVKFLAVLVLAVFMVSASSIAYAKNDPGTLKEEIASDKQAIKTQHDAMKSNAESAKAEEQGIKSDIKDARQAGDTEAVKALKEELNAAHEENIAGRDQDKKVLHDAKKEMKQDVKAAKRSRR